MTKLNQFGKLMAALGLALAFAGPAFGQTLAEITGPWDMKINMGGREIPMRIEVEERDGAPVVALSTPQGRTEAENVSYEDQVLTLSVKLGPAAITLELNIDGTTMKGSADSPLGALEITGEKVSDEEMAAAAAKFDALLGDWSVFSTFKETQSESEMRFFVENGELMAEVSGLGSRFEIERIRLEDDKLTWYVSIPYVTERPAMAEVTLTGDDNGYDSFSGTVKTTLGDVEISGELLDTTKLVQAAYDDPEPILGTWDVTTEFQGAEGQATLELIRDGERVKAIISAEIGTLETKDVEYKKINETMWVVKLVTAIPDLSPDPVCFELIVDGDTFTGEEIYNDEIEFYVDGSKS